MYGFFKKCKFLTYFFIYDKIRVDYKVKLNYMWFEAWKNWKERYINWKKYNFSSDLDSEIRSFTRDWKLDRKENRVLRKILRYNEQKWRRKLMAINTSKENLLKLKWIRWVSYIVKRKVNKILELKNPSIKRKSPDKNIEKNTISQKEIERRFKWYKANINWPKTLKKACKRLKIPAKSLQNFLGVKADGDVWWWTYRAFLNKVKMKGYYWGIDKNGKTKQTPVQKRRARERIKQIEINNPRKVLEILKRNWIRVKSSSMWYRENWLSKAPNRTCLIWLRQKTLNWALILQKLVGGWLTITWWTENWHASWKCSHASWHKLDFKTTNNLISFIKKKTWKRRLPTYKKLPTKVNWIKMTFYIEKDHIDVKFT